MNKKILIVAGEASGDRHAADLVTALKVKSPDLEFLGIGGDRMEAAGVRLLYHISQLAILGFVEIIKHIPLIRRVFRDVKKEAKKGIDVSILVDYPGFNLRLAKMLHKMDIPVIYYICPQMWAWGENRIKKFRRYVDLPIIILKFEEEFYKKHGIKAYFIGHPLIDQLPKNVDESEFRKKHKIPEEKRVIGLFPGSREIEVKRILPLMVNAVRELQKRENVQAIIAKAPHLNANLYEKFLTDQNQFTVLDSDIHQLMMISHIALVASGTATLELGYLQTPSIVLYAVSPVTYWIARSLVKIPNIALANIVIGKRVFPEFIQGDAKVENVLNDLNKLMFDEKYYETVRKDLAGIRKILGEPGATDLAAHLILNFLHGKELETAI